MASWLARAQWPAVAAAAAVCFAGPWVFYSLPYPTSVLPPPVDLTDGAAPVGVFVQVASLTSWSEDVRVCLSNVASAYNNIDVYVSLTEGVPLENSVQHDIQHIILRTNATISLRMSTASNIGEDMGPFLHQLHAAEREGKRYETILKVHSHNNNALRDLGLQSLCGSKWQVGAIATNFMEWADLDMIVPAGTIFDASTPIQRLAPVIRDLYYKSKDESDTVGNIVGEYSEHLRTLFQKIEPDLLFDERLAAATSGRMFWVRHAALRPQVLNATREIIQAKMLHDPTSGGRMARAFDIFLPSSILASGRTISQMPPAPKVMAIYFPQYHAFPENDRFWGRGFTEWTLLKPFNKGRGIRKPLSVELGGLGYYDLTDREVRKKQAQLAKEHGVHGFLFYHYWFTGEGIEKPMVMEKIPQLMLEDGEPDMPYFFNWANEPWTRKWNGSASAEDTLLGQNYGDEAEWQKHFTFLLPFFRHDKYIRINGKPVFAIYRPGLLIAQGKLAPMLALWGSMAQASGFPGIYFVNTHSGFWMEMKGQPAGMFDASYHFLSTCCSSGRGKNWNHDIATTRDQLTVFTPVQYWGAFTGFNNRVRRPEEEHTEIPVTPPQFYTALVHSFSAMASTPQRRLDSLSHNIFVVGAWNEWNEQNVLEPDDEYGYGYLKSLRKALTHFHSARFVGAGYG